ncbi:MAG: signal peptidase I [Thermoplasmatota archaeon]
MVSRAVRRKWRLAMLVASGVLLLALAAAPLLARTSTYPIAIVNGNSMYPTLHNGDMVVFRAPPAHGAVPNGTIIVFVQSQSGVGMLDSLLKPVLVHRVVAIGHEPDGTIDYTTKGDNNRDKDPFVTDAPQLLGIETMVIPYGGMPIQFVQNPYGLLVVSAIFSLSFFAGVDTRFEGDKEKKRLVAAFLRRAIAGEITLQLFDELRLVVEFYEELPQELIKDPALAAMIRWLKRGGLEAEWVDVPGRCEDHGDTSFTIAEGTNLFSICSAVDNHRHRADDAAPDPTSSPASAAA